MKIFNNLQELWEHCLFCPICKTYDRDITITFGPEENYKLLSFTRNTFLNLRVKYSLDYSRYIVQYIIDCADGSFTTKVSELDEAKAQTNKTTMPYSYFYIESDCRTCHCTSAMTSNIQLDMKNSKVYNFLLSKEEVVMLDNTNDSYHAILDYSNKTTTVYPCFKRNDDTIVDIVPPANFNLIEVDLMKADKAIKRMKNIIKFG